MGLMTLKAAISQEKCQNAMAEIQARIVQYKHAAAFMQQCVVLIQNAPTESLLHCGGTEKRSKAKILASYRVRLIFT